MTDGCQLPCPACKGTHELGELLDHATWWRDPNVVRTSCYTAAGKTSQLELRVETGSVSFGYVYGAGGPHFMGMVDHELPDLMVLRQGDHLLVEFGERSWRLSG